MARDGETYCFLRFLFSFQGKSDSMGLLTEGEPLEFHEAIQYLAYIRKHGILQFLSTYNRLKGVKDDELRWGNKENI